MIKDPGVDSTLNTETMCVGHYEIKPLIYEEFIEKNNCICTKGMLEMDSRTYTKHVNMML